MAEGPPQGGHLHRDSNEAAPPGAASYVQRQSPCQRRCPLTRRRPAGEEHPIIRGIPIIRGTAIIRGTVRAGGTAIARGTAMPLRCHQLVPSRHPIPGRHQTDPRFAVSGRPDDCLSSLGRRAPDPDTWEGSPARGNARRPQGRARQLSGHRRPIAPPCWSRRYGEAQSATTSGSHNLKGSAGCGCYPSSLRRFPSPPARL